MSDDKAMRAQCAAQGLAMGDALGAPASEHRTIRDPWVRQMLRRGATQLDESRVLRPVVPFVLSALGTESLVATDDTELFAVAARVILDSPSSTSAHLLPRWRELLDTDDAWMGTAQRSAVLNARAGLVPPQTGQDNPAFYDDTALPGALAAAIATDDPQSAAELARALAEITHDGVGVQAAALYASILSRCLAGSSISDSIDSAVDSVPCDAWLSENIVEARRIIRDSSSRFAAIAELVARFAPRTYSHPGTVTETLPLALAITEASKGDHEIALPLAMSVSRHQDSLPALVGALCGALGSAPDASGLDTLAGITIPAVAEQSLSGLVGELLAR